MKIHDFRLNYYIKHCAVILLTAWCFICLMEMPFNISCGINPVSDISSVSNISIAGHCAMVLSLFLILSTTIYLWLISLTASKELSILLLKLLECR